MKCLLKIYGNKNQFWQWDTKQKLIVLDESITQVHFCNEGMSHALVTDVYAELDGTRVCTVPDIILQIDRTLIAYAYLYTDSKAETLYTVKFAVKPREIPDDYVYNKEAIFDKIDERITALENKVGDSPVSEQIEDSINKLIGGAPEDLNTLNKISNALGNDKNFAKNVNAKLDGKVDKELGKGLSENDFTDFYKDKAQNAVQYSEVDQKFNGESDHPQSGVAIVAELAKKQPVGDYIKNDEIADWAKQPTKPKYTYDEVGADAAGTATTKIEEHNTSPDAHGDIRNSINELVKKINGILDSSDVDLDQLSEIVAYIKNNKELIDGITTNKVNISDIIDNLTTNVSNKPLSAAQGVVLKNLIDNIVVPTKLSELADDADHRTVSDTEKNVWNNKLSQDNLQAGVDQALAQAKKTGDFDGSTFTPKTEQVPGGVKITWENNGGLENPTAALLKDGAQGDPGVHTGENEPTNDSLIWINTKGSAELPVASENKLGGIKAPAKTPDQTVPVGIGEDNKLYVAPSGEEQVQSDWAENDPQSPAYVKNRFGGYEDATEEVIFPEQFLAFVDGFNETLMPKFSAGDTIKVVWGGEIYTCEAREIIPVEAPFPYVGNLAIVSYGADTGEPFIIGELEGGGLFYALSRVDGTFSLSLSKVSKTAIKIDPKYLPTPPDPLPPITPDDESAFLQAVDGQPTWVKLIDRSKVGG